jgi:hypothetical protein
LRKTTHNDDVTDLILEDRKQPFRAGGSISEDVMYPLFVCADPVFLEFPFAGRVKKHELRDPMAGGKAMTALEAELAELIA